jgi:hypothetical protein
MNFLPPIYISPSRFVLLRTLMNMRIEYSFYPKNDYESGGEKYTSRNVTREMSYKDFIARNNL